MHDIEPFYKWRNLYTAENDERSPFYGKEYSEFEFTNQIYNFLIHPQWDDIGSNTIYVKILFVHYDDNFAIIEMIGEWNDAIENDIMNLKRNVIDELIYQGITHFILIGENVLNFHSSDDSYYEEWFDDIENNGWITLINFREHVLSEMKKINLDYYLNWGGILNELNWRALHPMEVYQVIKKSMEKRLPF